VVKIATFAKRQNVVCNPSEHLTINKQRNSFMMTIDNRPISVGTRLGTMLLDHFFMTMIAMVFFLPGMISGFSDGFNASHEQTDLNFMEGPMKYLSMFGFALYFCKDIINGRSISKRVLKLQVIDNKTGQVATPLQCFVRNIFCIIWPIEVIVAMTNTSRRLGDKVAGTKLVYYEPTLEQPKINLGKTILPVVISYGLILLIMQLTPSVTMGKANYIETSYNQTESKELEKLISDSLGQYLTPDIRVYDTVKNESLKYISTIIKLKENYIADDNSYRQLHEMTTNLIYSKFPKEIFTGQIKYTYQGSGQFQSRATTIGAHLRPTDEK
jgi:uncharacterized RDD family membrane protein YckC